MHIKPDPLTDPAVISLLEFHTRDMAAHSPEGTSYALDLEALKHPRVTVFTVWDGEKLAGCGALNDLGDGSAEIKSMRTTPEFAGRGVGRALITHLIQISVERGYTRLSLETGTTPLFHTAIAFYASHGFVLGERFSNYVPSKYNIFMHLDLV